MRQKRLTLKEMEWCFGPAGHWSIDLGDIYHRPILATVRAFKRRSKATQIDFFSLAGRWIAHFPKGPAGLIPKELNGKFCKNEKEVLRIQVLRVPRKQRRTK